MFKLSIKGYEKTMYSLSLGWVYEQFYGTLKGFTIVLIFK
jgi:hypothetical protein